MIGWIAGNSGGVVRAICGADTMTTAARASVLIAGGLFTAALYGQDVPLPPAPPVSAAAPAWLDQGWTGPQRREYQHQSQGTVTLPLPRSWFLALQEPDSPPAAAGLFSDPAYLAHFGFIPSPVDSWNPDGLPVGFARTSGTDPRNSSKVFDRLGFTCAACHTGRIDYNGNTLLVDGAPAMIDLGTFGTKLAMALGKTLLTSERFDAFAKRVLGPNSTSLQRFGLRAELAATVAAGLGDVLQSPLTGNVTEGAGRLDALNRIGNTVFGGDMDIKENRVRITAPVAYPHIWDVSWFTWVQYNGSIEQPMVRNAGEAMGVSAIINFNNGPTPRYTSTIPVGKLHSVIENSLAGPLPPLPAQSFSGLRSPAWPQAVLGAIDPVLAGKGADLYKAQCQGCHLPAPNTPDFWASSRWTPANAAGQRYLDLLMIPIATIGTDPAQATDMQKRSVLVPANMNLSGSVGSVGSKKKYEFGPALGQVVERVVNQWYDAQLPPTSPADRALMNGYRPNGIRAPLAYKARPLDGIWATAPYLHNGAVPTLWDLLSPYSERPATFRLGSTAFDPVKVGYQNAGTFKLDTTKRGNFNGGHLFDSSTPKRAGTIGAALSTADRQALVEYLKTL